ncbi:MAG: alpha/beta hydrolase [Candidatus Competibacter sp.]|nr:alpha/beta hydrolase [Candidatus Competibacter sp.]MDG4606928.1 alpha/beta hydrolase [Candidatus Contendobacter sp.]HRD49451.1 alpha/beta hydrolase [Candidatus Contendobacter sp.]
MTTHVQRQRFDLYAAGHRLHAERLFPIRAAAGPTLVFLHEGLGSIGQWRNFPAQLCTLTGLPGLIYERWGFGRSDPLTGPRPRDYLHREAENSLPEVLAACGIADPPILFGHSDGGSIALLFAAAYPGRTHAVISEAAHVFIEEVCLVGIRAARATYEQGNLREGLCRYHGANTDSMFRGWCDTWLRPDFRDWNMTAELPRITCPVLIIQGEEDEYGTRAQVDTIATGVSGSAEVLWLPDCAHVPHHQAPDAVLNAAGRFISGVCAKLCGVQP